MLGVGALFGLKRPDEHWSDLPTIEVLDEVEAPADAGDPLPDPDHGTTLPATV
jgi:hypothetical protein